MRYRMAFAALSICLVAACNSSAPVPNSSSSPDAEHDKEVDQLKADLSRADGKVRDIVFASFLQSYPILDKGDVRYNANAYNKVVETSRMLEDLGFPASQSIATAVFDTLGPVTEHSAYDEFWSRKSSKSRIYTSGETAIEEVALTIDRTTDDGLDQALLRQQLHELAIREVCYALDGRKPEYPRVYKVFGSDGTEFVSLPSNSMMCEHFQFMQIARCLTLIGNSAQALACQDGFFGKVPRSTR